MSNDQNLRLVREMGADNYDPIPPEQYLCFAEADFFIGQRAHRMLAVIRGHCLQLKPGGRTAFVAVKVGRKLRPLMLKQIGEECGFDPSATIRVFTELEEAGLVRRDEEGRIWLCGKVQKRRRRDSEDKTPLSEDEEWEKVCTDNFPKYISLKMKEIPKNERASVRAELEAWGAFGNRACAEAMKAVRNDLRKQREDYFAQRLGVKIRTCERKPKEPEEARPGPVVKLSVQTFSPKICTDSKSAVYTPQNGAVQTSPNKEGELREQRYTSSSETKVVLEALNAYGKADDDAARKLIKACRQNAPDASEADIVREIHAKGPVTRKRDVVNPIGLLLMAVPKVFAGNGWRADTPPKPETAAQAPSLASQIASLEQLLKMSPNHVQAAQWSAEIADLKLQLTERNGHAKAQEAGRG